MEDAMSLAARSHSARAPQQRVVTGRVLLQQGDNYTVSTEEGGEVVARRAPSCLLAPAPTDRVLVALVPEAFVLAVLERDAVRKSEVVFDGDAVVRSRHGRLDLDASEGVRISTHKAIELVSRTMSLASGKAELFIEDLTAVAARARASFDEAGLVAKTVDTVAERMVERAARVFRFVSELDQLRARHFDYRAEHSAQIKGENTVVVAREVARMDGEQIHIG
jgi:hypothetical protein